MIWSTLLYPQFQTPKGPATKSVSHLLGTKFHLVAKSDPLGKWPSEAAVGLTEVMTHTFCGNMAVFVYRVLTQTPLETLHNIWDIYHFTFLKSENLGILKRL